MAKRKATKKRKDGGLPESASRSFAKSVSKGKPRKNAGGSGSSKRKAAFKKLPKKAKKAAFAHMDASAERGGRKGVKKAKAKRSTKKKK